jgi:hypothetical protein
LSTKELLFELSLFFGLFDETIFGSLPLGYFEAESVVEVSHFSLALFQTPGHLIEDFAQLDQFRDAPNRSGARLQIALRQSLSG